MTPLRAIPALLAVGLAFPVAARPQSCTNLCLQQVSCPAGETTSITGIVYAPNGTDPLPNIIVYIPNTAVAPVTAGVSCPAPNTPPSGSPLVGTLSAADGTFTLTNVPVGTNIPLVIQSGKWRRQFVIPGTVACANTTFNAAMPQDQTQGDIPRIAISTGSADAVECVLRKVGISDSEFTNPTGTGRINFFQADGSPGADIVSSTSTTPTADSLIGVPSTLANYDVVMLPCEGTAYTEPAAQLANLAQYANAGGRIYTSHRGYEWLYYDNSPFLGVVNWDPEERTSLYPDPGVATINTTFSSGQTLAQWLPLVGASAGPDEVSIANLRQDFNGVNAPTQSWLTLNNTADGSPVMQFTFDTPVGSTTNQCGRVLFNDYHVEDEAASVSNLPFPTECSDTDTTDAQEKLLEYSLFDLTSNGAPATLAPTSANLGSEPVGFSTAAAQFTWTNNAVFGSYVSSVAATGDFTATAPNCNSIAAGATCTVSVVFTPTALGVRTGTLTVNSPGLALTATLTGTGTPNLSLPASLTFGNVDLDSPSTQTITLTNISPGAIAFTPTATGDFTVTSGCGAGIAALSTCQLAVTFTPSATGTRTGTLTVTPTTAPYTGAAASLTGNGTDFSIAVSPATGKVIAGDGIGINATTMAIAGFNRNLTLTCATNAAASTCTPNTPTYNGAGTVTTGLSITTVSQYTVIGYTAGLGGRGIFLLASIISALLLLRKRRNAGPFLRSILLLSLFASSAFCLTGCSGKYPALDNPYTAPGSYTYTVTATDGILTHSATYTLTVTQK